ncbi:zinc ABC transporter substrate-binding protein [Sedimentitalea todarodis]|uniref:High-affinity zinc uptake system protein ZnuA n=1 Tax=Sedimentitalea todarodis TaxID=1631240 RepID=A0ABU3V8X8_9RHOB|nr:zinc ABC transporter substrate-binding protein [Sedimentitalea todarodis]MDU9002234.1 zinc ABC transporter substrate-binding protein [Sedimentitalea todarodis]
MTPFRSSVFVFLLCSGAVSAEVPQVVADIAPVHALAAQVMEGVGVPDLLIEQGASPHNYALRPSQARALQEADLVFWVGDALTPWLEKPLATLGAQAHVVGLLEAPGTVQHEFRDAGHEDHADGHEGHEDHDEGHEDHADGHEEHAEDHAEHHEHDHAHGDLDPHAWLDPENGKRWLGMMAEHLAEIDPQNAEHYRANAAAAQADLDVLNAELAVTLEPVKSRPFVTFHDAFQYFDSRFELNFAGALSLGDAADPSPARVAELRELLLAGNIQCAYREPQFNDRLLAATSEGTGLQIGVLDPLGTELVPGPDLYADLLRGMARSLADCGAE